MADYLRAALIALAMTALLTMPASGPAAAASAPGADGLSGTWRVSRICLTICASPNPVLKVVSHLAGNVFATSGSTRQVFYRIGTQVLVHGPKDSLLLTIQTAGQLMSGFGVGADGSTFKTTWQCVAAKSGVNNALGVSAALAGATLNRAVPSGRIRC